MFRIMLAEHESVTASLREKRLARVKSRGLGIGLHGCHRVCRGGFCRHFFSPDDELLRCFEFRHGGREFVLGGCRLYGRCGGDYRREDHLCGFHF